MRFAGSWIRYYIVDAEHLTSSVYPQDEWAFDASDLPSGTYLYRLETPQGSFVRTMLLAK